MAAISAQVTIPMKSGLPEDAASATFYFGAEVNTSQYNLIISAVNDFFNTATTSGGKVASLYSQACATAWTIKLYNLEQSKPRVPVATGALTAVVGTTRLPSEVALCLSYQAVQVSGTPQASRRGRLFIGPLHRAVLDETDGRPGQPYRAILKESAKRLALFGQTVGNPVWMVRSQKNNTQAAITNGWVDDAFDTQRRRGLKATNRDPWTQ